MKSIVFIFFLCNIFNINTPELTLTNIFLFINTRRMRIACRAGANLVIYNHPNALNLVENYAPTDFWGFTWNRAMTRGNREFTAQKWDASERINAKARPQLEAVIRVRDCLKASGLVSCNGSPPTPYLVLRDDLPWPSASGWADASKLREGLSRAIP